MSGMVEKAFSVATHSRSHLRRCQEMDLSLFVSTSTRNYFAIKERDVCTNQTWRVYTSKERGYVPTKSTCNHVSVPSKIGTKHARL